MIFHWVIQTKYGAKPFIHRDACVELWAILKKHFPISYAAVIMPDHAHWICATPIQNLYPLHRSLIPIQRKWAFKFESIQNPEAVRNHKHLLRQIRYVHLNPCRDGLCKDPLEWEWSTHWDILGLIKDPWVPSKTLFKTLKVKEDAVWFHQYVSSDPSVRIDGSPPLEIPQIDTDIGMRDLITAVAFSHRAAANTLFKKQGLRAPVIQAARTLNRASTAQLSNILGITQRAVQLHLLDPQNLSWLKMISAMAHDLRTLKVVRKESSHLANILPTANSKTHKSSPNAKIHSIETELF